MADNPFSVPLPPSSPTAASPNIKHINKVFTPEKTTENGQKMINFMHDEDYSDPDNNSGPSNACSDPFPSPSLLILYPLFKNDIKEYRISNEGEGNGSEQALDGPELSSGSE